MTSKVFYFDIRVTLMVDVCMSRGQVLGIKLLSVFQ